MWKRRLSTLTQSWSAGCSPIGWFLFLPPNHKRCFLINIFAGWTGKYCHTPCTSSMIGWSPPWLSLAARSSSPLRALFHGNKTIKKKRKNRSPKLVAPTSAFLFFSTHLCFKKIKTSEETKQKNVFFFSLLMGRKLKIHSSKSLGVRAFWRFWKVF